MGPPKTLTSHILLNTGYLKTFCCNPQLDQKLVFSYIMSFLQDKNMDVDQKHNLRQGKNKDATKGIWKAKQDRDPPPQHRKDWWKDCLT